MSTSNIDKEVIVKRSFVLGVLVALAMGSFAFYPRYEIILDIGFVICFLAFWIVIDRPKDFNLVNVFKRFLVLSSCTSLVSLSLHNISIETTLIPITAALLGVMVFYGLIFYYIE